MLTNARTLSARGVLGMSECSGKGQARPLHRLCRPVARLRLPSQPPAAEHRTSGVEDKPCTLPGSDPLTMGEGLPISEPKPVATDWGPSRTPNIQIRLPIFPLLGSGCNFLCLVPRLAPKVLFLALCQTSVRSNPQTTPSLSLHPRTPQRNYTCRAGQTAESGGWLLGNGLAH